jgi:glutathione S-transferase
VGLALRMKKLTFEIVEPSGLEDFQRWNPETGLLPVIDVDGTRVADSSKILDWLDAHFPEPPLLARDPRSARSNTGPARPSTTTGCAGCARSSTCRP